MPSSDTGGALQRAAGAVAVILLLAFLAMHLTKLHSARSLARATQTAVAAAPAVDVVVVHSGGAAASLSLPGETAAWYESTIYARVDGYVSKWYVDIGDHVKSGQVLALIDTPDLDAQLAAAKAKLQVAQAQVNVKQADAVFAHSTYERWRDSPKGVVSEQEREDKKAGDAAAEAQLAAARAQVELDQADVDRLRAFEQFKRVTAPYAGTIIERRIDIGNLVTAGSSASTTLLYRMVQDDPIRVFVDVPQTAAADLMRSGARAQIFADTLAGGPPISGTISRTADAIDPKARTFRAELDIPNADGRLVSGLYVRVAFQLENNGMSRVPAATLVFSPTGPTVAVVSADNTVRFRAVTIGRDDGEQVELSTGVSDGDRLVLNISNQIAEGDKVQVVAQDGAPAPSVAMRAQP
ncbi:MAG TPA: efflux RND transporter periplasmic adaptor subunit [Steroidobacteraceae bacterium]|nr:efflux RND transporter periplasmic adaptor subunit [Steroidobacteraceae bacterium]